MNSSLKGISQAQELTDNTAAEQIVNSLRRAGIWNAKPTKQLVEVARLGAKAEDLLTAIQQAKGTAGDPFAYGLKVVMNRLQASYLQPVEIAWADAPRSMVEARGEEVGIGKWDDRSEQWPQYKARVTHLLRNQAAAEVRPLGPESPP